MAQIVDMMAQDVDMANLEARLTTLGSQVEHLAQILPRPGVSSEESTTEGWLDELNNFMAEMRQARTQLSSFSRREEEITEREELLEQKEAEIKKREELLKQEVAEIEKIEELLERATETGSKAREALQQVLVRQNASLPTAKRGLGPSSSENPATKRRRQDLTVIPSPDTNLPSGEGDDSATNPLGLPGASEHVRNVWRQIEFPADWTAADSAILLDNFNDAHRRKPGKNGRYWPQQSMDRGSQFEYAYCLTRDLKRNGMMAPGGRCESHMPDQLCIDVFHTSDNPGQYDSASTDKRWRLEKRQ